MVSVIPRKKVLIPRFTEESIPKHGSCDGTERNDMKKLVLQKTLLQQTVLTACFPENASERNSERLAISSNLRLQLILFELVSIPRNGL